MWNRTNDPHNSEELMISEYYRRVEEVKELTEQLEDERKAAAESYDELMDLLKTEEDKVAHLQSVLAKDDGVVDLHEPILLYKSSVASDYYFKSWLENHADDEGDNEGLSGFVDALNSNDKDCINWFKERSSNYTKLVKTEQRTFKFTLQFPKFGALAYDPEYNKTQLIVPNTEYADERWVNMPLEEFTKCTAAKIREVANKAYREYKDEKLKEAAEKAEG